MEGALSMADSIDRWLGRARTVVAVRPMTACILAMACSLALGDPMKPLGIDTAPPVGAAPSADPMAPPAELPALRLAATRSDAGGRWQGLIGTRWLSVGDRFEGARVLEVDANRVLLVRDGRRETLYLLPPLLPTSAASAARAGSTPPHRLPAASAPSR